MWYTPFWEGRSKHHTACVLVLRKFMQLNHWSRFAKSLTCYQVTLKATQISSRLSRLCLSIPHRSNTFSNMSKLQPQKATLQPQPCSPARPERSAFCSTSVKSWFICWTTKFRSSQGSQQNAKDTQKQLTNVNHFALIFSDLQRPLVQRHVSKIK